MAADGGLDVGVGGVVGKHGDGVVRQPHTVIPWRFRLAGAGAGGEGEAGEGGGAVARDGARHQAHAACDVRRGGGGGVGGERRGRWRRRRGGRRAEGPHTRSAFSVPCPDFWFLGPPFSDFFCETVGPNVDNPAARKSPPYLEFRNPN